MRHTFDLTWIVAAADQRTEFLGPRIRSAGLGSEHRRGSYTNEGDLLRFYEEANKRIADFDGPG